MNSEARTRSPWWHLPGLPAYYLAATAARTGDEMVAIAVVLLVLERTGSAPLAGALVAAYTVPTLLSGPLLGAWLDHTRHRRAALAGSQLALALGMLGLLATAGTAPAGSAFVLAALVGLTVPMTSGGFTSHMPRFVPADRLPRAHAFEGVSFHTSAPPPQPCWPSAASPRSACWPCPGCQPATARQCPYCPHRAPAWPAPSWSGWRT